MTITISKKWVVFFGVCTGLVLGTVVFGGIAELTNGEIAGRCTMQVLAVLCFCVVYDGE